MPCILDLRHRHPEIRFLYLFLVLGWFSTISATSNATCYYPDGLESNGLPCDPTADVSTCCGPGFVCLSNGLCTPGPADRKTYNYKYYRSGCTDPTWKSSACLRFCIGPQDNIDSGQGVQSCSGSSGQYCCGHSYDCCNNSTDIFSLGVANIETTIPYISSSATAGVTATMTSTPTSTPQGKSNGVAIGVGVGVGIGGLAAILFSAFIFLKRRRSKKTVSRPRISGMMISGPLELESGETYKGRAELETPKENEKRENIPNTPLEMEHVPIYELEVLPDESGEVKQEERRHSGRFSWE